MDIMRQDYEKALLLRLKGYSYNEINQLLGAPKATLSGWFSGLPLSEKAQQRIRRRSKEGSLKGLLKRNRIQTHAARERATMMRKETRSQIGRLNQKDLLLIGAALYWAEGYKRPVVRNGKQRTYHAISFSNADPVMVRVFLAFLQNVIHIPKARIRAGIRIFRHINENEALQYWQMVTGLPIGNFHKTYYGVSKSSLGKRPYNRLPHGTVQIRIGDTKNFYRIMGLIDGISQHFKI